MNDISLPQEVRFLLSVLNRAGYEAWAVGGCVRDALLGKEPHDWDVTTSALPEETKRCFSEFPVIETGIRHGTVGVLLNGSLYEVTTYRTESGYTDHRHPDEIQFVSSLREDLSRRDFTVNAMAYHPEQGLMDPFGGRRDLAAGRIACVGVPDVRLQEDALRILRALRFAACYDWTIGEETAEALRRHRHLLTEIAPERIREELLRLLSGRGAVRILREYAEIIGTVLPEILPMIGFDQRNPHHCCDVWEHTLHAIDALPPEDTRLRLTMLLHDIGKPNCFTVDAAGVGHCYGHDVRSAGLSGEILRRLRLDSRTTAEVTELVARHGAEVRPEERSLRRWLNRIGETQLRRLLQVKRADTLAQAPAFRGERLARLQETERLLDELIAAQACTSLRTLAVKGNDLLAIGVPEGPQIGALLHSLLESVLDGALPNEYTILLDEAKRRLDP